MFLFALMNFISEEVDQIARRMEAKFQFLPKEGGILFVSVQPDPVDDGMPQSFLIRLGISRRLEVATGYAIVKKTLADEMKEYAIYVSVFRGVSGACRDEGIQPQDPGATGPAPS